MTQTTLKPKTVSIPTGFMEKHFPPKYWAKRWGVDATTIVRWFRDEPGVLRLGSPSRNGTRTRCELRIPATVAERIYRERTGKVWG